MTPDNAAWGHHRVEANGVEVHYVRGGSGPPLVLLHGWPEFWFGWRKNIPALAQNFDVIVPDLRGFGDTEKPGLPDPPSGLLDLLVEDLRSLVGALGIGRFGIVSHDVGSYVAQAFAREYPESPVGLFFFNCVYPGIGRRWLEPQSIREIWYQTFNQQPWAASLVGRDRETCRIYVRHFLDHWAHRPGLFDEDLDAWVDNFMKPGNLQGGFDWYIAVNDARTSMMRGDPSNPPKIEVPAYFLWGEEDPVLKFEWSDRLGDYFSDHVLEPARDAGHFVHYERPELANREILRFFAGLRSKGARR